MKSGLSGAVFVKDLPQVRLRYREKCICIGDGDEFELGLSLEVMELDSGKYELVTFSSVQFA